MEKFNKILYFDILDFNYSGKFLTFKKAKSMYVCLQFVSYGMQQY